MTTERHVSTTGAWRLVRGGAVGVCASGLGALAHVSAGGATPALPLLLALTVGVTGTCAVASRWRWTLPSLAAAMALAQLTFHQVFAAYGASGADAVHSVHTGPQLTAPMAAAHSAAALGTALALRFGESWLRAVVDLLGRRLLRLFGAWWSLSPRRPQAAVPGGDAPVLSHDAGTSVWSRGPPR